MKTPKTIEQKFLNGDYDEAYATFIMENATDDRIICNGDSLVLAMEARYMADEFLDYLRNVE